MKKKVIIIFVVFLLFLSINVQAESKFEFREIKFKETNSKNMLKMIGEVNNNTNIDYDTVYFNFIAFKNKELINVENIIIQNIYANSKKYFEVYLYDVSLPDFNNYKIEVKELYKFK